MMRIVALGVVLAAAVGCGPPGRRGRAWVGGDRSTYVCEQGGNLRVVRPTGDLKVAVPQRCGMDDVIVSGDGRRAVMLGWESSGRYPHSSRRLATSCLFDLTTGSVRELAAAYPGLWLDASAEPVWAIGARTGWLYGPGDSEFSRKVHDGVSRSAELPVKLDDGCDLVERADAIVVACARHAATYSARPSAYPDWLEISELDPASFPPRLRAEAQIEARADEVRLSRDGRRVAWVRTTYRDGGDTADGGVIELATRRTLLTISGTSFKSPEFSPDGSQLVVLDRGSLKRDLASVRRFAIDASGAERARHELGGDAYALWWLADGRILVSGFGMHELLAPSQ